MADSQTLNALTAAIGNFGFPIVVAGYLLFRFEKRFEVLNGTIRDLLYAMREDEDKKRGH